MSDEEFLSAYGMTKDRARRVVGSVMKALSHTTMSIHMFVIVEDYVLSGEHGTTVSIQFCKDIGLDPYAKIIFDGDDET